MSVLFSIVFAFSIILSVVFSSSRKRDNNFSANVLSGVFFNKYLAKNKDFTACFETFFFQAFLRIFFFDFETRFC